MTSLKRVTSLSRSTSGAMASQWQPRALPGCAWSSPAYAPVPVKCCAPVSRNTAALPGCRPKASSCANSPDISASYCGSFVSGFPGSPW